MFRPVIGNSASAIPIAINCIFMGRDENEIPHKFISVSLPPGDDISI